MPDPDLNSCRVLRAPLGFDQCLLFPSIGIMVLDFFYVLHSHFTRLYQVRNHRSTTPCTYKETRVFLPLLHAFSLVISTTIPPQVLCPCFSVVQVLTGPVVPMAIELQAVSKPHSSSAIFNEIKIRGNLGIVKKGILLVTHVTQSRLNRFHPILYERTRHLGSSTSSAMS
jgi:hypothetical protein